MTKEFYIIKTTNFKKIGGVWVSGYFTDVISTILANNRREAFEIYLNKLSSSYITNRRDLTAIRHGKNKKRRTETLIVLENKKKEGE